MFINKKPQFTQEITLSLQVENTAKSPKVPCIFHSKILQRECAQSSIIGILYFAESFSISFIGAVFQKVCCTIIALVLSVIFVSKIPKSKDKFVFSMST
ncbi:MAG: hypothetical protein LBC61_07335 [Candidatus Peribacteria bacterium]|nr:hypothetical protein [Candidatus Peribacteria bacterium]